MGQKIDQNSKDVYVDLKLHGGQLNDLIQFLNRVMLEPGNAVGQSKALVQVIVLPVLCALYRCLKSNPAFGELV